MSSCIASITLQTNFVRDKIDSEHAHRADCSICRGRHTVVHTGIVACCRCGGGQQGVLQGAANGSLISRWCLYRSRGRGASAERCVSTGEPRRKRVFFSIDINDLVLKCRTLKCHLTFKYVYSNVRYKNAGTENVMTFEYAYSNVSSKNTVTFEYVYSNVRSKNVKY